VKGTTMNNLISVNTDKIAFDVFAYKCLDRSRSVTDTSLLLKNQFNIKMCKIHEDTNLVDVLNTNLVKIKYLAVDSEEFVKIQDVNVYDYVNMLSTIMSINGTQSCIVIMVSVNTDLIKIKEFMNIPEVKGIMVRFRESSEEEIHEAIADLKNGKFHIPSRIKQKFQYLKKKKKAETSNSISLTPRQTQIVELVLSKGASNKVIANILKISESTVKLHITNILKKYGLRNRTQLALFAKTKD
jgi:DNA-binding NarL/FixJ family response regulator